MANTAQTDLHDPFEPLASPAGKLRVPGDVLDFCSCGKNAKCPQFHRTEQGITVTDTDFPGVEIKLTVAEAKELAIWLQGHFGG